MRTPRCSVGLPLYIRRVCQDPSSVGVRVMSRQSREVIGADTDIPRTTTRNLVAFFKTTRYRHR